MIKGMSVHIGLNFVDPQHYQGWDGELRACIADAEDMQALAKKQRFSGNILLTDQDATVANVFMSIKTAALACVSGDIFFLTYSGHGGQVQDGNGDESDGDRMDETWCLYDREVVDDELYSLWSQFKPGVRILILSDSCHSGTVTRLMPNPPRPGRAKFMPPYIGAKVEKANASLYADIQQLHKDSETVKVSASVLLISGCMDNQVSMDGETNGAFTGMLKTVWRDGKFSGNYKRFRDRIVSRMPDSQTPNYYFVGAPNRAFEIQRPFTI